MTKATAKPRRQPKKKPAVPERLSPWDKPGVAAGIDAYWQAAPDIAASWQALCDDLRPHLAPGDVLEVGCGSGRMYGAMRDAGLLDGRAYRGGDLSTEMLALARANYPGVEFSQLDALALEPASADNVLCFQVLQQLPDDWGAALAQLAGAARRVLYVATWFGDGDRCLNQTTGAWQCWLDYSEFLSACQEYGEVLGRPGVFGQTGSVVIRL